MAPFSHLSSHHSPSPLPLTTPPHHSPSPLPLTTPPHHSDPTHPPHTIPHYHFSSLPSLLFTPMHSPPLPHYSSLLPLTTSSHHPPHYSLSLPLTTPPHLPSSPHLFTTLFLTYLPNHTPLHHPLHTSPHHSKKGHHNTKGLVKSHFSMSLNLCRTFLSLKKSFLILFYKKKCWDKINQKLEYDGGGGAHVLNCARATSSNHFSTCNILPLKKTLISHFRVLFVFN